MMTYDLLFVVLMILSLSPAFLIRDDNGGQGQLSTTASGLTSDPQSGLDLTSDRISAMQNSSVSYGPSKNLSLSMRNASRFARSNPNLKANMGEHCDTASDCNFVGAVCSKDEHECRCQVGEYSLNGVCTKIQCKTNSDCLLTVCENGACVCDASLGFHPDDDNVNCVGGDLSKVSFVFAWWLWLVIVIVLLLCGGCILILVCCGMCVSCGIGGGSGGGGRSSRRSGRRSGRR